MRRCRALRRWYGQHCARRPSQQAPRYLEGARYSAQWAGMPYPVYAGYKGQNDLSDDINVRSRTIDYLWAVPYSTPKNRDWEFLLR